MLDCAPNYLCFKMYYKFIKKMFLATGIGLALANSFYIKFHMTLYLYDGLCMDWI